MIVAGKTYAHKVFAPDVTIYIEQLWWCEGKQREFVTYTMTDSVGTYLGFDDPIALMKILEDQFQEVA